jgi:hypothetical protein
MKRLNEPPLVSHGRLLAALRREATCLFAGLRRFAEPMTFLIPAFCCGPVKPATPHQA